MISQLENARSEENSVSQMGYPVSISFTRKYDFKVFWCSVNLNP